MLIDPRLFIFPTMFFRSDDFPSCGFSNVISVFAFFVLAVSTIDKIAQMTLIDFVFDVEISS